MGWKNVKAHYRIEHIVQVREYVEHRREYGPCICIGSPYIGDIIVIGLDGELVKRADGRANKELKRYMAEFDADPAKLKELVTSPDTFERSLPVFTYEDGKVIEKECEEYGWPNPCHDGDIQYDNTFSKDKSVVVAWAKLEIAIGLKWNMEHIDECSAKLHELRQRRERDLAAQAALDREYPDIPAAKSSYDD